jgi:hypothetical protein
VIHTPAGQAPAQLNVGGNIIQGNYGTFRENNSHPYSAPDATVSLTGGRTHTLISTNETSWTSKYGKRGVFDGTLENVWLLQTNATLDMGANGLTTWCFTNYPGSTLILGDPYGIELIEELGNITAQEEGIDTTWPVAGTNYFEPNATYIYDGSVAQSTGGGLPPTVANVTINNAAGVTVVGHDNNTGVMLTIPTTITAVTNTLSIISGGLNLSGSMPMVSGLSGYGALTNGSVTLADRGLGLLPGAAGVAGTLTLDGVLSFGTPTKSTFDLSGSPSSGNDQVVMIGGGSIAANGATITINPLAPLAGADYVLFSIQGSGSVQSDFNRTPAWSGGTPSYATNYSVITSSDSKQVLLHYTAGTVPPHPPTFGPPVVSEGNLVLTGTSANAEAVAYRVWSSTDVALPFSSWTLVQSGSFLSGGSFSNAIPINASDARRFYKITVP